MKNVALITGGSGGIGKELAIIHAQQKGDLVLVARRQKELQILKDELESTYKIEVKIIAKDLTEATAPQHIYDQLMAEGIGINYLINNAGFGGQGFFWEREWQKDEDMIQLNIMALTELCRLFLPDFVKRNDGKILNVSSTAGLLPGPLQAVYYATKAYVNSFSQALAGELSDTKVTVTALLPVATETGFAKRGGLEQTELFKGKMADAHTVAKQGYEGMMKGELLTYGGVGLKEKITFALMPFVPKKLLLNQVKKLQQKK